MTATNATIIKYQGVALPTTAGVTLFDSTVAFPGPTGSFHLLAQNWFQYALNFTAVGGGVVTGNFSDDHGVNWKLFYTSANIASTVTGIDEVYVAMYKDVQFIFTPVANTSGVFIAALALNPNKSSSTRTASDKLI